MLHAKFTRACRSGVLSAIALTVALFTPQLTAADTSQYPMTITDGMGNSLTLKHEPARVSSKTLFTDQVLLDMLPAGRLTSLTPLASDANFSNVADQLPAGVPLVDLSVEAIISHYPDIVFAANWSDAGKIAQLKQAGINVYLIKTPTTIKAIQAEISKIAMLLNVQPAGQQIIDQMDQKLAAVSEQREQLAAKQWLALDYNTWGTASGEDTTWDEVLDRSGLINAVQDYEMGAYGQVPMSKELIVEINPDVIFLPGWIYDADGDSGAANAFRDNIVNDPALRSVSAVKHGRIYQVPERLRGTFSQHLADAVQYVIEQTANTR